MNKKRIHMKNKNMLTPLSLAVLGMIVALNVSGQPFSPGPIPMPPSTPVPQPPPSTPVPPRPGVPEIPVPTPPNNIPPRDYPPAQPAQPGPAVPIQPPMTNEVPGLNR